MMYNSYVYKVYNLPIPIIYLVNMYVIAKARAQKFGSHFEHSITTLNAFIVMYIYMYAINEKSSKI